jgi:hypothetical protein
MTSICSKFATDLPVVKAVPYGEVYIIAEFDLKTGKPTGRFYAGQAIFVTIDGKSWGGAGRVPQHFVSAYLILSKAAACAFYCCIRQSGRKANCDGRTFYKYIIAYTAYNLVQLNELETECIIVLKCLVSEGGFNSVNGPAYKTRDKSGSLLIPYVASSLPVLMKESQWLDVPTPGSLVSITWTPCHR